MELWLLEAGDGRARCVAFAVVIIEVHYRRSHTQRHTTRLPTNHVDKLKLSVGLLYTLLPPQTAG